MSQSIYTNSSKSTSASLTTRPSFSKMSSAPNSPTPPIAALPSFTHSLSSFPTMTTVAHDMVHYGTHARTKNVSEAKLNTVLATTKQRKDAVPSPSSPSRSPVSPPSATLSEDDEEPLTIQRKKHKLPVPQRKL